MVGLTVDLLAMEEIKLSDLFPLDDVEFRKTFFEQTVFPGEPITSYNEENFEKFFPAILTICFWKTFMTMKETSF